MFSSVGMSDEFAILGRMVNGLKMLSSTPAGVFSPVGVSAELGILEEW